MRNWAGAVWIYPRVRDTGPDMGDLAPPLVLHGGTIAKAGNVLALCFERCRPILTHVASAYQNPTQYPRGTSYAFLLKLHFEPALITHICPVRNLADGDLGDRRLSGHRVRFLPQGRAAGWFPAGVGKGGNRRRIDCRFRVKSMLNISTCYNKRV